MGNKIFRFEIANAGPLVEVRGKRDADITDQVLIDALPQTVMELHEGLLPYDYALCFFSEMRSRGLIYGYDFHVELPSAERQT